MRKLLLLLLLFLPFKGNCSNAYVVVEKESTTSDENSNQGGIHFTVEILSDTTIRIISSEISTFNVKIFDAKGANVLYQGTTENGIFHITGRAMDIGHYVLRIEVQGVAFVGEFDITSYN